jgi:hypothetical protein
MEKPGSRIFFLSRAHVSAVLCYRSHMTICCMFRIRWAYSADVGPVPADMILSWLMFACQYTSFRHLPQSPLLLLPVTIAAGPPHLRCGFRDCVWPGCLNTLTHLDSTEAEVLVWCCIKCDIVLTNSGRPYVIARHVAYHQTCSNIQQVRC